MKRTKKKEAQSTGADETRHHPAHPVVRLPRAAKITGPKLRKPRVKKVRVQKPRILHAHATAEHEGKHERGSHRFHERRAGVPSKDPAEVKALEREYAHARSVYHELGDQVYAAHGHVNGHEKQ